MASTFPRPQQPINPNIGRMNNVMGAMRGNIGSIMNLIAQRNPNASQVLSMLNGMSPRQLEDLAKSNPSFMEFYQNNRDKGIVQTMRDHGFNV